MPEDLGAGRVNACTIVTRNYIPRARVVASSFLRWHERGHFTVLIIDDPEHLFDASGEPFDVIGPDALDIDEDEYALLASMYDVIGLASALKPKLLEHLLAKDDAPVLFLDSDTEVFAPLDDLATLAGEHGVVLSPHTLASPPDDGLYLTEATLLQTGVFNTGFAAVHAPATAFLDWWWAKVRRDCVDDRPNGLFYEQRCLDLAVTVFEPHVLRDVTVNVAFWNLHERHVAQAGDGWTVNGEPLRLFHFSGYDVDTPFLLTSHQVNAPRILFSDHPALKELCDGYADRLTAAGWDRFRRLPYGYARTGTGFPLDGRSRWLLRNAVLVAEAEGTAPPPLPFGRSARDGRAFVDWLQNPRAASPPTRLGRYLESLWLERFDLQQAFPRGRNEDAEAFRDWCDDTREALRIPWQMLKLRTRKPLALVPSRPRRGGVNIAGYFRAELGIGENARLLHATLQSAGIPSSQILCDALASRQSHPFEPSDDVPEYDTNLVVIHPQEMPGFADDMDLAFFEDRYTIGVWAWETDVIPPEAAPRIDLVDEIWTPSEFSARAFRDATDKPVVVMPHAIEAPPVPAEATRASLGLPEGFMFLHSFDHLSGLKRKNPLGVIEAYKEAFNEDDGAILVVRSINGVLCRLDHERVWAAAADRVDIHVIDGYLDPDERGALLSQCDCYVSLHRATSFGLTTAEAMALGKPVVATGYSGNLEYMTNTNSTLVPFSFIPVGRNADPYPADSSWAEPDLDAAASLMRRVFRNPEEAKTKAARARAELGASHSIRARAADVEERLEAIAWQLKNRADDRGDLRFFDT